MLASVARSVAVPGDLAMLSDVSRVRATMAANRHDRLRDDLIPTRPDSRFDRSILSG
jgi:hypothetical protein